LFLPKESESGAVATEHFKGPRVASTSYEAFEPSFDRLSNKRSLLEFFNGEFRDPVPFMPALEEDFFRNPTGALGTIRCWPWNLQGKVLLLGDAAHAMVPFYGQGMNCAFEDVRVLDQLVGKYGDDWQKIYWNYGDLRKFNADAIQDMAEENFYEMRDRVADPVFQRKRELETRLEQTFPNYSMVTFREDMPYSEAKEKGNAQDQLLMEICKNVEDVNTLNLKQVMTQIRFLSE